MENGFVKLEGKSRSYYLVVAALVVVTLVGVTCFGIAYASGHQTFGSTNAIPWGLPITLAIFLIGLSAGLHILAFLIYILGHDQYRKVIRMAVFLAVVLIFGAIVSIAVDLGRPEKFWRLFMFFYLNNMSSMFAINAIFYTSYLISAVVYLIALLANMKKFSVVMGMVAFGWAMLTHGGTGAIFGFIGARETWFSSLSPFEFIIAAFASSIPLLTLVLLLVFKSTGRKIDWSVIGSLAGLTKIFLISLIIAMLVNELTHIYPSDRSAIMYMLFGHYAWLFWALQIFLGIVVPLFLLFYKKTRASPVALIAGSILVVIGIFIKRYYLVIPGAAYPQHYYPGHIEGVYGALGRFTLTPVEIGWALGMCAFLALVFILGLKYLELLPAKEDEGQVSASLEGAPAAEEQATASFEGASPATE